MFTDPAFQPSDRAAPPARETAQQGTLTVSRIAIAVALIGSILFIIGIIAASLGLGTDYVPSASGFFTWAGVWWTLALWSFWSVSKFWRRHSKVDSIHAIRLDTRNIGRIDPIDGSPRLEKAYLLEAALEQRRNYFQRELALTAAGALLIVIVLSALFYQLKGDQFTPSLIVLGSLAVPLFLPAALSAQTLRNVSTAYNAAVLEREIEEFSSDQDERERRAEKLLRVSRVELSQYYRLNLSQNRWLFLLGAFWILCGVAVLAFTMLILRDNKFSPNAEGLVAATGFAGSVLTNVIAAIFIKMYAETGKNFEAFHTRLATSYQVLHANLLVAGIENQPRLRNYALRELALQMAGGTPAPILPPNLLDDDPTDSKNSVHLEDRS